MRIVSLEEKFGNLGKIGAEGEDKAYDILQDVFYEVTFQKLAGYFNCYLLVLNYKIIDFI